MGVEVKRISILITDEDTAYVGEVIEDLEHMLEKLVAEFFLKWDFVITVEDNG